MNRSATSARTKWWHRVVLAAAVLLAIPIGIIVFLAFVLKSIVVHITIWTWWCARGRDVLLVYSDSPLWREYIELHILPHLRNRVIVLNWSERKRWSPSLARLAFLHFRSYREFNPLVVVFRPFRRTRTFRFWKPFKDLKHGRPEALRTMEQEFFSLIGVKGPESAA
jgi:hypothetical protein